MEDEFITSPFTDTTPAEPTRARCSALTGRVPARWLAHQCPGLWPDQFGGRPVSIIVFNREN